MLFKLVDEICADIDRLSLKTEAPGLEQQILHAAPEAIAHLIHESRRCGSEPTEEAAATVLALSAFGYIKGIPLLARQLIERLQDESVEPSKRSAIASVLSYLVQPHDLIPDDAPGGYGFLDDTIMLRAGLVAYVGTLPQPGINVEVEAKIVTFLTKLTPEQVRPPLQQAVSVMSHSVQVMSLLEPEMANFMLAQIIANPLQAPVLSVPPGFTPRKVPDYAGARWSGGAYFEGNNMMVPGGPALVPDEVVIPS